MNLIQQTTEALIQAPSSLRLLGKRSSIWLGVYFIASLAVFSIFTWFLLENQETIKTALLDYFFPTSWHSISEKLANFLFETQTKTVLGNAILGGSLVIASIFLFPIKEKYSETFEKEAPYNNGKAQEFPLLMQAWEETKLFLLYLTAQAIIIWLGYYPYTFTKVTSIILSYFFLFFTFGLDFISPTLQRHRIAYTLILKSLFKNFWVTLLFGLLFSLPMILLSQYIFSLEDLTLMDIIGILFISNVLLLTLAVPAGTRVASTLLPEIRTTKPPSKISKKIGYSVMMITLACMLFLHGKLIASLHHKSQILKAEYSLDWSSIDYQLPSISELLNGNAFSNLSFDMVVTNPTQYDIVIEKSQILVEKNSLLITTFELEGFNIPAGESKKVRIKLDSNSDFTSLTNLDTLLQGWRADLKFELWPGIPFVVNIAE